MARVECKDKRKNSSFLDVPKLILKKRLTGASKNEQRGCHKYSAVQCSNAA